MSDVAWLRAMIKDIPDHPRPGVTFRDITPLLADVDGFRFAVDAIADHFSGAEIDVVVGIEARGWILAAPIAYRFGAGFAPVRKAGRLPRSTHRVTCSLEYGEAELELHRDAISAGQRVLVVDDVLATGGTARAAVELVGCCGGDVAGLGFLAELIALGGRGALADHEVHSVVTYG